MNSKALDDISLKACPLTFLRQKPGADRSRSQSGLSKIAHKEVRADARFRPGLVRLQLELEIISASRCVRTLGSIGVHHKYFLALAVWLTHAAGICIGQTALPIYGLIACFSWIDNS